MINVFIDCEFTHFHEPHGEPPELISIGAISEDGRTFYAENADLNNALCSEFVHEAVLPLLEGGAASMAHPEIATKLRKWVEAFGDPVKFWSDAPSFDWPHVYELFEQNPPWPINLRQSPVSLSFETAIKNLRFAQTVESMYSRESSLRRHHALDDAVANRLGFLRVK